MKTRKLTSPRTVWSYSVRGGRIKTHAITLAAGDWVDGKCFETEADALVAAHACERNEQMVTGAMARDSAEDAAASAAAKRRALQSGATLADYRDGAAN